MARRLSGRFHDGSVDGRAAIRVNQREIRYRKFIRGAGEGGSHSGRYKIDGELISRIVAVL